MTVDVYTGIENEIKRCSYSSTLVKFSCHKQNLTAVAPVVHKEIFCDISPSHLWYVHSWLCVQFHVVLSC